MLADLARWTALLDELERGAVHPEQAKDWAPPTDLGSIPADVSRRARDVLELLTEATARAEAARADIVRQLSALRQVPRVDTGGAVYLDTSG